MKDDAVSAPVGVMILLGITVITAGLIAGFAFGAFGSSPAEVPDAEFSVTTAGSGDKLMILFEHTAGEPLQSRDLKITSLIKNRGTDEYIGSFSAEDLTSSDKKEASPVWSTGTVCRLDITDENAKLLGAASKSGIISAAEKSTPMEIKIYHLPSGKIIYQTSFVLRERNT